jgi:hypothetical protein
MTSPSYLTVALAAERRRDLFAQAAGARLAREGRATRWRRRRTVKAASLPALVGARPGQTMPGTAHGAAC